MLESYALFVGRALLSRGPSSGVQRRLICDVA